MKLKTQVAEEPGETKAQEVSHSRRKVRGQYRVGKGEIQDSGPGGQIKRKTTVYS